MDQSNLTQIYYDGSIYMTSVATHMLFPMLYLDGVGRAAWICNTLSLNRQPRERVFDKMHI